MRSAHWPTAKHRWARSLLVAVIVGGAAALIVATSDASPAVAGPTPFPRSAAASSAGVPLLSEDECAQVIVYSVRGSGQLPQGRDAASSSATWDASDPVNASGGSSIDAGTPLESAGSGFTPKTSTPFTYALTERIHSRIGGQLRLSWAPIVYPAVSVSTPWPQKAWLAAGYPYSLTSGVRSLHQTLMRQWELCGSWTRYVLVGYSQGADVITSYLRGTTVVRSSQFGVGTATAFLEPSPDVMRQIASVELIADPNHDTRDAESYSDRDPRLALRGGLSAAFAGLPRTIAERSDSFCLRDDAVCGAGLTIPTATGEAVHTDGYLDADRFPVSCEVGDRAPRDTDVISCAADRVVERLGIRNLALEPLERSEAATGATGRDVAFFLDTTGSMSDDIDAARQFARDEGDRIVALDGRVALVQYRDVGDLAVEVVVPFTADLAEFEAGLSLLEAGGGGDTPEGLLHALRVGFEDLEWEFGASKAAVVLTDAGFHEPDRTGGETLPQIERLSLEIDPVNVFPVVDGSRPYSDLAARTSGAVIEKGSDTATALSLALDDIADRPTALLSNTFYTAAAGREVVLDASSSEGVDADIVEYRWDVDGDGFTDTTTAEPTLSNSYPDGYSGVMQVLVVDDLGRTANASAAVQVAAKPTPGRQPLVPTATSMTVAAEDGAERVTLNVGWEGGVTDPARWLVTVDGDPVDVVLGGARSSTVAVDYQAEPWKVGLTPMDDDGYLGPVYTAELEPLPGLAPWHERPLVWVAGVAAALLTVMAGAAWVVRRRRKRTGPPPGPIGAW